ncbi:MAG TPA: DUF697 domain-containing protein [Alphaproteobacteria bacterium]|nr:DUF697 domain-containing protein [Alphaproteobacteria bacterium]
MSQTRTGPADPAPGIVDAGLLEAAPRPAERPPAVEPGPVRAELRPAAAADDLPALPEEGRRTAGVWLGAVLAAVLLTLALLGVELAGYVGGLADWSPALAALVAALAALAALAAGRAVLREALALRRLRSAERLRAAVAAAERDGDAGALRRALAPALERMRPAQRAAVQDFDRWTAELDDAAAIRREFERSVLRPVDAEADVIVRAHALRAGLGAAVSPHPALDALVVLWIGLRMVRRVAEAYGLRPSALSTARLMRHCLVGGGFAGMADMAADAAVDVLAGGVAARLAAAAGETAVSATRIYRLGRRAIALCRPLPQD